MKKIEDVKEACLGVDAENPNHDDTCDSDDVPRRIDDGQIDVKGINTISIS